MKPWQVYDRFGRYLGTVWAERKGWAMFLAERDLKARPGSYVGRAFKACACFERVGTRV